MPWGYWTLTIWIYIVRINISFSENILSSYIIRFLLRSSWVIFVGCVLSKLIMLRYDLAIRFFLHSSDGGSPISICKLASEADFTEPVQIRKDWCWILSSNLVRYLMQNCTLHSHSQFLILWVQSTEYVEYSYLFPIWYL